MKALLQFLSVPISVIGLVLLLAFSEGIADGSIPLSLGVVGGGVMILVEFIAFNSFFGEDDEEDFENGENPDE